MIELNGKLERSSPEEKENGILKLSFDSKEAENLRRYIKKNQITIGQAFCVDIGKYIRRRRTEKQSGFFYELTYRISRRENVEAKTIRDLVRLEFGPKQKVKIGGSEYMVPKPIRLYDAEEMSRLIKCIKSKEENGWATK
jgi:hypothetical protein